jgi:hypothetical protein
MTIAQRRIFHKPRSDRRIGNCRHRWHGTNQPQTIGNVVFTECYRLMNAHVIDLYGRVAVRTKIVVRQKPTL